MTTGLWNARLGLGLCMVLVGCASSGAQKDSEQTALLDDAPHAFALAQPELGALPANCFDYTDAPQSAVVAETQAKKGFSASLSAGAAIAAIVTDKINNEKEKEAKVKEALKWISYCFPGYNLVIAQPHDGSTQHMKGAVYVTTLKLSDTTYRAYVFKSGVFYQAGDLGYKNWAYSGYFSKSADGRTVTFSASALPERRAGWTSGPQCQVTTRGSIDRQRYYGLVSPASHDTQNLRMLVDDLRSCFPDYNLMVMHDEQPHGWTSPPSSVVWASSYTMQDEVAAGESTEIGKFGPGVSGRGHYDVWVFKTGTFQNRGDGGYDNWAFYGNHSSSADGKTVTFFEPTPSDLSFDPAATFGDVDFGSNTAEFSSTKDGPYPGCSYHGSVPKDADQLVQSLVTEYQRCFPKANVLVVKSVDQFSFSFLSGLRHIATVNGRSVFLLDGGVVSNAGDGGYRNWGYSGVFERDGNAVYFSTDPNSHPSAGKSVLNGGAGDPMEQHPGGDDGGRRPEVPRDHAACRPDGLVATKGVATPYCRAYQGDGREWLGEGRTRRVVGYFNGGRTGADGKPYYLVKNIPWSKLTHINYAFAHLVNDRIAIGAEGPTNPATGMEWPGIPGAELDASLPYKGHFNLLTKYKKLHPRVKTLISVGGWAESGSFYTMTTREDGTVNQSGIDAFADSVAAFLRTYGFDGVDIDFEYPTALDETGNPQDWDAARARRKGLPQAYDALMRTLRERLDLAGAGDGHYYLLTSASSASGYIVRGME
ncbi:MAG: chitinase, partial [Myxococcaceae bacterium]|nr:chitinase [Myxococcaceae bacterium]